MAPQENLVGPGRPAGKPDAEATQYQTLSPSPAGETPLPPAPTDPDPTHYRPPSADSSATRYDRPPDGAAWDAAADSGEASDVRTTDDAPPDRAQPGRAPDRLPRRFGEYELLEEIARGGMGVVYKARQVIGSGTRVVALKMMLAAGHAGPAAVERFLLEARAAATLEHPHIVPIYDVGVVDGMHYFTMQLIAGGSLQQRLTAGPLPPREAARLVRQVAGAVQYAHDHGIIHRDVKPHNILLASACRPRPGEATASGDARPALAECVPKLTDFGLVRTRDSGLSVSGEIMGTPSYMPPEQAEGRLDLIGPPSDVYGLGAVLYCLLTGRPPFQSASSVETMRQVCEQEPVPPRRLNPQVPADLETVCLKCLEKAPPRRYPRAGDFADDLRRWLAEEPVRARPVPGWERALKWVRRRPALAATYALLVLVVVLGAGGGGTLWLWRRAERARDQVAAAKGRTETALLREQQAKRREEAAREELAQLSYFSQVDLAYREWKDGNVGYADRLLARCEPARRHWEWGYVHRLCHGDLRTLRGHTHHVTSVTWAPDGRLLASCSDDRTVRVWDAVTGREVHALRGHTNCILGVAFAPDGWRLASASWDGTVKIWDARTGRLLRTFARHTGRVWTAAFSPDGRLVASGADDRVVQVWEAATGRVVHTLRGHGHTARSVAFSPDGKTLATASYDRTVRLWDLTTGRAVRTLQGHSGWVLSVSFSPDGRRLATASLDETVRLWDVASGHTVRRLAGHAGLIWRVVFRGDGRRLASASRDRTVKVWDAETGTALHTFKGHSQGVTSVAFSPDGTRLVSASWDGTLKLWDAGTSQEARALTGHASPVLSVAFSPDGTRLASTSEDGAVKEWSPVSGRQIGTQPGHGGTVLGVAYSPDGRRLASGSALDSPKRLPDWMRHRRNGPRGARAGVKVWAVAGGREVLSCQGHARGVRGVTFSPDGTRLAGATDDGRVRVWDAHTGKSLRVLQGHTGSVHAVAFSPDGRHLVSAAEDWLVRVWDVGSGRAVRTMKGHTADVYGLAFAPGGRLLASASWDGTVKVWDVDAGKEVRTLHGHTGPVYSVAFSPDGRRLVSASGDRVLKLWDTASGREVLTLKGHAEAVHDVAFSPDGRRLASASWDRTVRIWEASTGPTEGAGAEGRRER